MATGNVARNFNKLFVGNLPWTIGNTELKQYFSQFGHVTSVKVVFDRETGMSKHFGFIEVADRNTYETILAQQTHKLEGKTLSVKYHVE